MNRQNTDGIVPTENPSDQHEIRRRYWFLLGGVAGSLVTFVGCLLVVAVA